MKRRKRDRIKTQTISNISGDTRRGNKEPTTVRCGSGETQTGSACFCVSMSNKDGVQRHTGRCALGQRACNT